MSFYQSSIANNVNNTPALFVAWAGNSGGNNGISYALAQVGLTLQATDAYTAKWAADLTGTQTTSVLGSEHVIAPLNGSAFPTGVFPLGRTALASTHFNVNGTTAYGSGSYIAGDVVTFTPAGGNPGVFICISPNTGSAQSPTSWAGGTTTLNATYWQPYHMEIWEFTGGALALTPIYMKIEYGWSITAVADPMVTVQFGTGWSAGASGYLTGNVTNAEYWWAGGVGYSSTECDFTSDGSNYLAIQWARGNAGTTSGPSIFCMERSISGTATNAPIYNSSYLTYIRGCAAVTDWCQQSMFLSGSPSTCVRVLYGNAPTLGGATTSLIVNNTTPALPVFPLVGYCGNPMTVIAVQQEADTTEGAVQSITVYGTALNYIATKTAFAQGILGLGQTTMAGVLVRAA